MFSGARGPTNQRSQIKRIQNGWLLQNINQKAIVFLGWEIYIHSILN